MNTGLQEPCVVGTQKMFQGVRSCPTQACHVRYLSPLGPQVESVPWGDRGAVAADQPEK